VAATDGESIDSWVEALARRHQITPRAMLPALGLNPSAWRVSQLVCGLDPQVLRRAEQLAGLEPGRLDDAVGDRIAPAGWLPSNGSRFCPECLADSAGRWQLRWRLSWVFACARHQSLLRDRCPACGGLQRTRVAGGQPFPPATCTRQPGKHRCGADLTAPGSGAAAAALLAAQQWIDALITDLTSDAAHADPDRPALAGSVLADLPAVSSWLLRHLADGDLDGFGDQVVASWQAHQALITEQAASRDACWLPDAPLTAALAAKTRVMLGPDDDAAIGTIAAVLARVPNKARHPPPGMPTNCWKQLTSSFPNRFLRAADQDLKAGDRLRLRSLTPRARPTVAPARSRTRFVPQLLWPDWTSRMLPPTGMLSELFRAVLSVCLLLPGEPTRGLGTIAARLNPRLAGVHITRTLQTILDASDTQVLVAICRLADYLDDPGGAIDYQRRRDLVPAESITWDTWRALSLRARAHPGENDGQGRHLHAQRHLHQLLTGADLADPAHTLAFRTSSDRIRYLEFTASLTTPLRLSLRDHAHTVLDRLGIDEPLTWSPPPECCHGLTLPGLAPDELDLHAIRRIIIDEGRTPRDAADQLQTNIDHIRLALEHIERPTRQWGHASLPQAWQRHQKAAELLTRDFFEREYLSGGKSLRDIATETGLNRALISRFARDAGIPLAKGKTPLHIDPTWLREAYLDRKRTTAQIAAELGTSALTVQKALRHHGIPLRAAGVRSHPHMLIALGDHIPQDIRSAVHGNLRGWHRLHRFHAAMQFPSLGSAASHLGAHINTLIQQFHRLESDIGGQLFHRGAPGQPQQPTERGRALLQALEQDEIHALITEAVNRG
jgi:hypothetical protein